MTNNRKNSKGPPWGRVSALLAACLSILVGVAAGLEPDVILQRTLLASFFVGVVVCVADAAARAVL